MRASLVRVGWAAAALLLILVILKSTVADVYRVGSRSMRPTIFGGKASSSEKAFDEHVLVWFGGPEDLSRFDLAVVRRRTEMPIIKRVLGLPGERVGISGGDWTVNGARLPLDVARPEPIPVFDEELHDVRAHFLLREGADGPWSESEGAWRLDARGIADSDAGMMLFRPELLDDYIGPDGERVIGRREVNDARIECEARFEEPGMLRFRLVEAGDTFEARIEPCEPGFQATLVRFNSKTLQGDGDGLAGRIEVLARMDVEMELDAWTAIAFENVDNHLVFDVGEQRLTTTYAANEPHAGPTAEGAQSLGPRAALGGEGTVAGFRGLRVLRDLYYSSLGTHGVTESIVLGPDEYFVLGDNSSDSRDSRMFGPVLAGDVIGRPTRIVWPLDRARVLDGPRPR